MQLQYLKYLLDIEQTNSLTKTAEINFVSRQALTKSLQSLEKEIGYELYYVSGKKVYLTPAGRIVTDFAKVVLTNEQIMYEKLTQLNTYTSTNLSLDILSISAITNLCTNLILNFYDIGMTPVDISVSVHQSHNLVDSIELIKTCSNNIIFLTISSDVLPTVVKHLAGHITSYTILLEDIAAICCSKDLSGSSPIILNSEDNEFKHKHAIFSLLPSRQVTFSKTYQNISCDAELIKNLLMNKNTIVYLPYKLALKTFNFKPNRYIPLPQYKISHIILFKSQIPFQNDLTEYLKSKLA